MGEGNGNPLQCSCLENAGDGGAWWAAIYGVAQSRTRLKWLSNSSSREKQYHFNLYSRVPLVVKESTRLWNFFVKLHRIRSGHNSKPRTMTCATTNMGIFFCKATLKGEILKRLKDIVWFHFGCYNKIWGFPGGSDVKVPTMQDTQVWSLGWEDTLEKGMSTHSSILAWRIPWEFRIKKPGGFQPIGWQRTNTETHTQ